jgi:hypothetical protein
MGLRRNHHHHPPDVVTAAEAEAQRQGLSVSAWLSRAADHAARLAQGQAAAIEVLTEIGPPSEAELEQARAVLQRAAARQATPGPNPNAVSAD